MNKLYCIAGVSICVVVILKKYFAKNQTMINKGIKIDNVESNGNVTLSNVEPGSEHILNALGIKGQTGVTMEINGKVYHGEYTITKENEDVYIDGIKYDEKLINNLLDFYIIKIDGNDFLHEIL